MFNDVFSSLFTSNVPKPPLSNNIRALSSSVAAVRCELYHRQSQCSSAEALVLRKGATTIDNNGFTISDGVRSCVLFDVFLHGQQIFDIALFMCSVHGQQIVSSSVAPLLVPSAFGAKTMFGVHVQVSSE